MCDHLCFQKQTEKIVIPSCGYQVIQWVDLQVFCSQLWTPEQYSEYLRNFKC